MGRIFRIVLKVALAILLLLLALIVLWRFIPPVSTPMLARWAVLKPVDRQWVPLSRISPNLRAAAIMGEDAHFCSHRGVDWDALQAVMDDSEDKSI